MSDLNKLIDKIIPYPASRENREGFNNEPYIDKLNDQEKKDVENALIEKLSTNPDDMLIVETLAYLKSTSALPLLNQLLTNSNDPMKRIIMAVSISEIDKDDRFINSIITDFRKIDDHRDAYNTYKLIPTFYYLRKLKNQELDKIIEEYSDHKDHLVSNNAKRSLNL